MLFNFKENGGIWVGCCIFTCYIRSFVVVVFAALYDKSAFIEE